MNNLSPSITRKVLSTSPDVFAAVARAVLRRKGTAKLDYWFGRGRSSSPPMQLDLKITNRCDLRCFMCAQWGDHGYNLGKSAKEIKGGECTADDYARLAAEVAAWKPLIYIWGGEPLLYPHIQPVVEEFKARGLMVSMVTNGTTLAQHADWLVAAGLDLLMVSLDGPPEVHDRVRGPGACERLRKGLAAVREARAANGGARPYLAPLITINRENTHVLPDTFAICEEEKADFVAVYYSWFTNQAIGEAHQARFQHHFGENPWSWVGWSGGSEGLDVGALMESRRTVDSHRWAFPYIFVPNLPDESSIREYYRDPSQTFGYKRCLAPYYMVLILPNGDVATCRDYPDYVVANIRDHSLAEIFNHERYQRFRRALKEDGLFPICSRCCGLMGY
jgi:radical SAM protein with 4Fe4S-binding SPASM domain